MQLQLRKMRLQMLESGKKYKMLEELSRSGQAKSYTPMFQVEILHQD